MVTTPSPPAPITPTRVIPAGQPIPTAPPMPAAPPGATNLPPWRTAAPPPAPPPPTAPRTVYVAVPPPPPVPVHVHVTIDQTPDDVEPEPTPRRSWQWLITWARPWRSVTAAAVVLLPIPSYGGYSLTSAWSAVLQEARTDSLTTAYVVALVAAGSAFLVDHMRPAWWTRALLIITVIGGTGALGWYDPVTLITGVHP